MDNGREGNLVWTSLLDDGNGIDGQGLNDMDNGDERWDTEEVVEREERSPGRGGVLYGVQSIDALGTSGSMPDWARELDEEMGGGQQVSEGQLDGMVGGTNHGIGLLGEGEEGQIEERLAREFGNVEWEGNGTGERLGSYGHTHGRKRKMEEEKDGWNEESKWEEGQGMGDTERAGNIMDAGLDGRWKRRRHGGQETQDGSAAHRERRKGKGRKGRGKKRREEEAQSSGTPLSGMMLPQSVVQINAVCWNLLKELKMAMESRPAGSNAEVDEMAQEDNEEAEEDGETGQETEEAEDERKKSESGEMEGRINAPEWAREQWAQRLVEQDVASMMFEEASLVSTYGTTDSGLGGRLDVINGEVRPFTELLLASETPTEEATALASMFADVRVLGKVVEDGLAQALELRQLLTHMCHMASVELEMAKRQAGMRNGEHEMEEPRGRRRERKSGRGHTQATRRTSASTSSSSLSMSTVSSSSTMRTRRYAEEEEEEEE